MSNLYKGEMQDYEGNTIYPHTDADIVFTTDGKNVQEKLNGFDGVIGDVTEKTSSFAVNKSTVIPTSELTYKLNQMFGGVSLSVIDGAPYATYKVGADTVKKKLGGRNYFETEFTIVESDIKEFSTDFEPVTIVGFGMKGTGTGGNSRCLGIVYNKDFAPGGFFSFYHNTQGGESAFNTIGDSTSKHMQLNAVSENGFDIKCQDPGTFEGITFHVIAVGAE